MHRSRRKFPVKRLCFSYSAASLVAVLALLFLPHPVRAQEPYQYESDLVAKRRLYSSVGAGFRQIRRGPNGNYYLLTAPSPAVLIYDSAGKQIGQVPNSSAA